jgi:hypothetical protein
MAQLAQLLRIHRRQRRGEIEPWRSSKRNHSRIDDSPARIATIRIDAERDPRAARQAW